tara:strand:+ start:813 stop:1502 length:690 start_codon:yes stop_codon:yes gene_type:complete
MGVNNILIVEDEVLIANYLKRCLQKYGYNCAGIAISFDQALHLLGKEKIDAVLLDINIYGSKSGIDLGNLIKQQFNIPFLYLTSYTDTETIHLLKETAPKAFLVKPINEVALATTLDLLFIEPQLAPETNICKFKIGITTYRVNLKELHYIMSDANYVDLHLTTEKKLIRSTLKDILKKFPENSLIKINRRVAVNPEHVAVYNGKTIKTSLGKIFKVSNLLRENLSKNF